MGWRALCSLYEGGDGADMGHTLCVQGVWAYRGVCKACGRTGGARCIAAAYRG